MTATSLTRALAGLVLVLAAFSLACQGSDPASGGGMPAVLTETVEVGPLKIDGIVHSMEGEFQSARLDTTGIGWITGLRAEVVDAATGLPMGDEFLGHGQIQMDTGSRLMVAATGIGEVSLPDGFGIPLQQILGDLEPEWRGVSLMGMVLNNHDPDLQADVNVRFDIDYVASDDETAAELVRPLYRASVTILPDKSTAKVYEGDPLVEVTVPRAALGKTGHWVVPPGMQVVKQQYRGLIGAETQVHFGTVHLHNYGRLVSLTNVTNGDVLWQVEARHAADRDQIVEIPVYASDEGFTLRPDHVYELAVVYDNTSDVDADAMATMYLYHQPAGGRTLTYPPPAGAEPPSEMADTTSGRQH